MKGIILAGGRGTRLNPLTQATSKQLLPIYDKPMIYYPLSVLMLAGIKEILIISTPEDLPAFQRLLKDGLQWGLKFSYKEQIEPRGLADAFIIGKEFIGKSSVCLILGDNIFFGNELSAQLRESAKLKSGAIVFAYEVSNPQEYGIIRFNDDNEPISIVEKPKEFVSNYAIPGIYFYDSKVVKFSKSLQPSKRGEIEITDLNNIYLNLKELKVKILKRGNAWLDAGTHDSLLQAASFVQTIQQRQGLMIACIEEIAYKMNLIDYEQLMRLGKEYPNNYGKYILSIKKK
jgi:glucose-1-phosphate thymidylyltransferase